MSFQQIYYTSSTIGLRGGKGFQIHAATPGIDDAVLRSVERLGGYVAPVSAPTRPTDEEIARFPLSLLYHRLPEGPVLLAQAKYTGKDYSGRFGNYFTHSLLTSRPAEDLRDLLPIEAFRSPSFCATERSDTALSPLAELRAGSAASPERVQEHLRGRGRMGKLPAFLTAVVEALRLGRRVVLVEEGDGAALWIAAASFALPRHLAFQLTFNTYVKNPHHTGALVVGTTIDSDFGFAPHEILHQFSVFDFIGQRFTSFPAISPFAAAVAAVYESGAANGVAGFLAFAARVAPDVPIADLDVAFAAYAILAGLRCDDAISVVRWCAARVAKLDREELCSLFRHLSARGTDAATVGAVIELWVAVARQGGASAAAVDGLFVEWLLGSVATVAPPAFVLEATATIDWSDTAIAAAAPLREGWLARVDATSDPARLGVLLDLGERLGLARGAGQELRRAGERTLGPALRDALVQRVVRRLARRPEGEALLAGVGDWLSSQEANDVAFRSLLALRDDAGVLSLLEKTAREKRALSLRLQIIRVRADGSPARRARAFEECLRAITECGAERSPEQVDSVFLLFWGSSLPNVAEARSVLSAVRSQELEGTRLFVALAEAAQRGANIGGAEPEREGLLADLAAAGSTSAATLCEGYLWAARLRHAGFKETESIPRIIHLARSLADLGRPLLALASERLVEVEPPAGHAALYRESLAIGGRRLRAEYVAAVTRILEPPPAGAPRAASLFSAWTRLPPELGSELLEGLPKLLERWSRADLDEIERSLSGEPETAERFRQWRVQNAPRKGLLDRLRAFLVFGSVVLFTLGVALGPARSSDLRGARAGSTSLSSARSSGHAGSMVRSRGGEEQR